MKGFILFSVLLILQLLSLLSLYLLKESYMMDKVVQVYWLDEELLWKAEAALSNIESTENLNLAYCVIKPTNSNDLLSKPLEWWENQGCQMESDHVIHYYVIQILSSQSCLQFESPYPVFYLRLTLLTQIKNNTHREILQSTIIKLDNANHDCVDIHFDVKLGRQSWRRL